MTEPRPGRPDFRKIAELSSLGLMLPSSIRIGIVKWYSRIGVRRKSLEA